MSLQIFMQEIPILVSIRPYDVKHYATAPVMNSCSLCHHHHPFPTLTLLLRCNETTTTTTATNTATAAKSSNGKRKVNEKA